MSRTGKRGHSCWASIEHLRPRRPPRGAGPRRTAGPLIATRAEPGRWSIWKGGRLLSNFSVTNLNDSGGGSLRQAIIDSNGTTGPNEIDFAAGLSGTITLTSGELLIANHDVKIVGPGQNSLSVSGNGNSRVFEIASGVSASLSGMTITGGRADNGGGIYNAGTLTVADCTISGNSHRFRLQAAAAASTTAAR